MKVLDLQCAGHHAFEGWFGSEDDFRRQLDSGQVACPVCGDTRLTKMLSAPRLNLGAHRSSGDGAGRDVAESPSQPRQSGIDAVAGSDAHKLAAMKAAWWRAAREAVSKAEDVGDRFAREARRIHHGEAEERGIRGRATGDEVRALVEEGVPILPLPDALKQTLQ